MAEGAPTAAATAPPPILRTSTRLPCPRATTSTPTTRPSG